MPKRNEFYGFEVVHALRTRKRQARMSVVRTVLGYLCVIGLGVVLGLMLRYMGL